MAAYEKKKGRLLGRKDASDSTKDPSGTLQKSAFSSTPNTLAVGCTSMYSEQATPWQPRGEQLETVGTSVVLRQQTPTVGAATPACGQSTANAPQEPRNTGVGDRSQVADTHAQKDVARLSRDAATANLKASPKTCCGSRPRRREHVTERKTTTPPGNVKATEAKTGRHIESVNPCHGAARTHDAASPASTTSDEADAFVPQEKGVADTTFGSSLNLQQLSQSSTSATPPASDCGSDESPASSPDVADKAAPHSGRRFGPVTAVSTNSVSNVEAGGELTPAGTSPKATSARSGESSTRNEGGRSPSSGDSLRFSSNAMLASVSNWSFTPRNDTQETRRVATQSAKPRKSCAHRRQSPSSARAKVNKGHCQRASSRQRAAGHGNAATDNRVALTVDCGLLTSQEIPHRSAAQSPTQHGSSSATSPPTTAPPPPSLPLTHATKLSVFAAAAHGGLSPAVVGRADMCDSPTACEWRSPSPGSLRAAQGTLQGRRTAEDKVSREMHEDRTSAQKRAECARQPKESLGRGPAGSADDNAARNAVAHIVGAVGLRVGNRSPAHQVLSEKSGKTADTQRCSWKQAQQCIGATTPFGLMPFSRVVGSTSTDSNANRVLNKITSSSTHHPAPPPMFPSYPSADSAPPATPCVHAADTPCFAVDGDAYSTSLDHFSTTVGCYTEVGSNSSFEANATYTASEQLSSEPLQHSQQHTEQEQQQGSAATLMPHMACDLESPRGGDTHMKRSAHAHTCNVLNAGDARTWARNCAETNSLNWSLMSAAEVPVKPANLKSSGILPPPIAPSNTYAGSASDGSGEERREQLLAPAQRVPCDPQSDLTPGTAPALVSSDAEPATVLAKPLQRTRPPTSIKMAVANDAIVFPPRFPGEAPRGDRDIGSAKSACAQWYPSPPPKPHGYLYKAGQGDPLGEKQLVSVGHPEDPFALLHEKQKRQPWQKATGSDSGSITCSGSRCCSSYCCAHSPTTSLWPQTAPHSAKSSPFCNSSCIEDGGAETHQRDLLTFYPPGTMSKNYAGMAEEKPSGLHRMDCHTPSKHVLQQERQQVNSRMVEEMHVLGDNCSSYGALMNGTVVDVPRGISGSNSGALWSMTVPPISLLLTLPLNLPFGKIVKFGSPSVLPQTTMVLPPPPPPTEQVLADCEGQRPICGLTSARPPLMPRTLGAKKSYYCFSPALHPGAYTLFSHAGGICDTFAASLHLELAILYVPPPLLGAVASIFQSLAPRLPRLASPLRLECGGLEERNAPGRFGGKVLTVSCAVGDQQERYKFQQMQEFLMLFQSKVELLLREYTLQQHLLMGRRFTSIGQHRQGQGGASVPGKKHNIWRYAMSCLPTSLGCNRLSGSSPTFAQGNVGLNSGNVAGGIGNSAAGVPADVHGTEGEAVTCAGSNNGGGGTGGGFLDLTIRAFEAKALDKATKDYARRLVVKDVCVSEIRLVTTRGIEDKTCEIDPRFPQYSIGTRPIVLGPNGQLCRHSLVDVHALPDVWEVRLRPGNTRDEQKRLVERCVLASIENKPLQVRNETLKAAIDAGVILWANGKIMLLPPPPPPALEEEVRQEKHQKQHQKEQQEREATRANDVYGNGELQQQEASPTVGMSSSRDDDFFNFRDSTRPSTQGRDPQGQTCGHAAPCSCRQSVPEPFLSLQGEDFFGKLLLLSNTSTNASTVLPGENDDSLLQRGDTEERKTVNAGAALTGCRGSSRHQGKKLSDPAALSALAQSLFPERSCNGVAAGRAADSSSHTHVEALLAQSSCSGVETKSVENRQDSDGTQYQMHAQQHREHETNYLESLAAAIAAVPPGLDVSERAAALRAAMRDTRQRLPPALGQTAAKDGVLTHTSLGQTHQLLEVIASGWSQQQKRQEVAEVALKKQQEKDLQAEAEEGHEQCADVKQSVCDSVLQHMPVALQYFQQLQHAMSSERLESGTPGSPAPAETSLLLKRLLSLPSWSSDRETFAHPHEQKRQQQQQQQGGGIDWHTQLACGRSSGATCDARASISSGGAASAARGLLTRSRSSVVDLAKLLQGQETSGALKDATAATFVHSLQAGGLSRGGEESEAVVLSNSSGVNANCSINNGSSNNSNNSSSLSNGAGFGRETEAEENVGDGDAVSHGELNGRSCTSLSYSCPFRATVTPARNAHHEISKSATDHKEGVAADMTAPVRAAEAVGNWGVYLGDPLLPPSIVRELADSNPFPEELSRRQQLLHVSCAAARETADTNTFNERQYGIGAAVSEQMRSRAAQQQQVGKRVPQHQRLPPQDHQQTPPQRRDNGQHPVTQEMLDRHAFQLLRPRPDAPVSNIYLQEFLTGDLLQQCNFRSSSCPESFAPAAEEEAAFNLLQQCGADGAIPHHQANLTDNYCDMHMEGLKQNYSYSQL